jgi:hypothetical protein
MMIDIFPDFVHSPEFDPLSLLKSLTFDAEFPTKIFFMHLLPLFGEDDALCFRSWFTSHFLPGTAVDTTLPMVYERPAV